MVNKYYIYAWQGMIDKRSKDFVGFAVYKRLFTGNDTHISKDPKGHAMRQLELKIGRLVKANRHLKAFGNVTIKKHRTSDSEYLAMLAKQSKHKKRRKKIKTPER